MGVSEIANPLVRTQLLAVVNKPLCFDADTNTDFFLACSNKLGFFAAVHETPSTPPQAPLL